MVAELEAGELAGAGAEADRRKIILKNINFYKYKNSIANMTELSRRELIGRILQGAAVIGLADKVPEVAIKSAVKLAQREKPAVNTETNPLTADIIARMDRKQQEAYLRAYLANPENTRGGRPGQNYIAARMVNGQPTIDYFYTPGGMWGSFDLFGYFDQPRAIKYLKP